MGTFDGIRVQSSTITTRACDAFVFSRIEIVRGAASGLFGGGALVRTINYGHKAPPIRRPSDFDLQASADSESVGA